MLTHADIWRAIDRLAREYKMSPSGLARRAGLDPTTFNKSKRTTREGKSRWPSTESVSKILRATGASVEEFVSYLSAEGTTRVLRRLPVIGYTQAGREGYFDDSGHPVGSGWDEVDYPNPGDPHAYALEINDDALRPVYRVGDVIIMSPSADTHRGDRVVLRTTNGQMLVSELVWRNALKVELLPIAGNQPARTVADEDIAFIHRIVWASQ